MDGHEIHTVLGVHLDALEDVVLGEFHDGVLPRGGESRLVDGYGAHHTVAAGEEGLPDGVDVPAGAEVHDGVGAVLQGDVHLADLRLDVGHVAGGPDVGVDLHGEALADGGGDRIMYGVAGHADAPRCDTVAYEPLGDAFGLRDLPEPLVRVPSPGQLHDGAHINRYSIAVPYFILI